MNQTVMAQVSAISTNHPNPSRANRQMLEVIEANQKLSSRVTQKDLIWELIKKNIALKDVASIEYKQRQQRKRIKEKDQFNH